MSASTPKPDSAAEKSSIIEARRLWMMAVDRKDISVLETLLAESFFCVRVTGERIGRTEFLRFVHTGELRITDMEILEDEVHSFGGCGVTTSRATATSIRNGVPFKGQIRISSAWIHQKEKWLCAFFHASDIRKQAAIEDLKRR